MFVKVSEKEYVNTDHIETILYDQGYAILLSMSSGEIVRISESAAQWILKLTEADESLEFDEEKIAAANTPNLKAQIAQALRDTWRGAPLIQLLEITSTHSNEDLAQALTGLINEKVVVRDGSIKPVRYYHVSNAPKELLLKLRPTPGLSTEGEPPASNSQDNSAPTLTPNPGD